MAGTMKQFVCPHNGATYSCNLGTKGCVEPFNPACCLLGAGSCPFKMDFEEPIVGKQKTFTCPDGSSYTCSPGSEEGCLGAIIPECCPGPGKSTKACPFKVSDPRHSDPKPFFNVEVCACIGEEVCPLLVKSCATTPTNPLCAKLVPFCERAAGKAA